MSILYTPADLQSFILESGINAALIGDIGDTPTVPAAAQALGVEANQIIKTLLFLIKTTRNDVGSDTNTEDEPTHPVVVISHGERLVDRKVLSARFNVGRKRVKLAPPDVVLDLLGYPAGGVPPFGHRTALPVILDASIMTLAAGEGTIATTTVYGGGGDDRTMLKVSIGELLRVVQPEVLRVS